MAHAHIHAQCMIRRGCPISVSCTVHTTVYNNIIYTHLLDVHNAIMDEHIYAVHTAKQRYYCYYIAGRDRVHPHKYTHTDTHTHFCSDLCKTRHISHIENENDGA